MSKYLPLGFAVAALVLVGGGCAKKAAEPSVFEGADAGPTTLVFSLSAQNNSGESGTATVTPISDTQSRVSVELTGAPAGAQPAHIHMGACPTPGGVKYPLTNVVNGKSETTLDVTVSALKAQAPLALNVHKSPQEIGAFVSCGNLPL